MTRRETIVQMLKNGSYSVRTLATFIGKPVNTIASDMDHIRKSETLDVDPARCIECGFVFRKREKLTTPSRCPECKSERVEGPWMTIPRP